MSIVHELRAKDVSLNDCSIGLEAFKMNKVMTEKLNLDLKELKSDIANLNLRESKLEKELLGIALEINA
jgi:hypothetical protein